MKDVDLISYLPQFMQCYKELIATFDTENVELKLIWKASDKVLSNEFIKTADEYGISRFEKLLNIKPSRTESLETRRDRVSANWFKNTNYTYKYLIAQLTNLCGVNNFDVDLNYNDYAISITVPASTYMTVNKLLYEILPCNLTQEYHTTTTALKEAYLGGGAVTGIYAELNPLHTDITIAVSADMYLGSGVVSRRNESIYTEIVVPSSGAESLVGEPHFDKGVYEAIVGEAITEEVE